jgi:hypothetical protein
MTVYLNLTKPSHGATDWDVPINNNLDLIDTDASVSIHTTASGELDTLDEKTTPVDTDVLVIEDSEAGYAKKKILISNLPTATTSGTSGGITILNRVRNATYAANTTGMVYLYPIISGIQENTLLHVYIAGTCHLTTGTAELTVNSNLIETLTEDTDFVINTDADLYDNGESVMYAAYSTAHFAHGSTSSEVVKSMYAFGGIYAEDDSFAIINFTDANVDNFVYITLAYTQVLAS